MPSDRVRLVLLALAAIQLATAAAIIVAPGAFYDAVANFGARDDHLLRDNAAFPLASALLLWLAVERTSWREPVLLLVWLQYVVHAANHVIDIGAAEPGWVGPVDVASLAAVGALGAWAWRQAASGTVAA